MSDLIAQGKVMYWGTSVWSADEIMELILRLVKEYKKTVLMVTHDPVVAARADMTLHLEKGVLVEAGRLQSVSSGGVR